MNDELDLQLNKDGQAIKELAEKRISSRDFSAELESVVLKTQPRKSLAWTTGLAAAISLTVIFGAAYKTISWHELSDKNNLLVENSIDLNLEQLPLTIEQKINQPLIQEQQAIIDDLKALKERLLSI